MAVLRVLVLVCCQVCAGWSVMRCKNECKILEHLQNCEGSLAHLTFLESALASHFVALVPRLPSEGCEARKGRGSRAGQGCQHAHLSTSITKTWPSLSIKQRMHHSVLGQGWFCDALASTQLRMSSKMKGCLLMLSQAQGQAQAQR
eukprot:189233-Pelagomonas_calceolata.AAC.4